MTARVRYVTFWNQLEPQETLRPDENEFPEACPQFQSETWPLLESRRESITAVRWWERRRQWGPRAVLEKLVSQEESIEGFFRLEDLQRLSNDGLDRVFTGTAGSLTIFFETGDQWLLRQLCDLWPRRGVLHVDRERLGALSERDYDSLCRAVATIPQDRVWFTFDDEGFLLYVFGSAGLLAWASDGGGRRQRQDKGARSLIPQTERP